MKKKFKFVLFAVLASLTAFFYRQITANVV